MFHSSVCSQDEIKKRKEEFHRNAGRLEPELAEWVKHLQSLKFGDAPDYNFLAYQLELLGKRYKGEEARNPSAAAPVSGNNFALLSLFLPSRQLLLPRSTLECLACLELG